MMIRSKSYNWEMKQSILQIKYPNYSRHSNLRPNN